ncbi:hypothetical protein EVA_16990, partial [gut metagenome]
MGTHGAGIPFAILTAKRIERF